MKMIVAIIDDARSRAVSDALQEAHYRATQLASTGGLLRGGTTTFMVGIDDQEVEKALGVIQQSFSAREASDKVEATIYVLNVREFDRV